MRKLLLLTTLLSMLALPAFGEGPVTARVYTATTTGVKASFATITAGTEPTPITRTVYVGCTDENFQVLAWKYDGTSFHLVSPAVADTSSAGALANSFMKVQGKFDFLVIKTATAPASASVQQYNN